MLYYCFENYVNYTRSKQGNCENIKTKYSQYNRI